MNQLILDLENKIKFNNKLLLETISNVCKNTELNKGLVASLIQYNNFDQFKITNPDETFLKLSIINQEYNKIQKELQIQIDNFKSLDILKNIGYNIFQDIFKYINNSDENTIHKIQEYSNNALIKLYNLKNIDIKNLKYDLNGLLTKNENYESFTKDITFVKSMNMNIQNNFGQLNRSDIIAINTIENSYINIVELYFKQTKELNKLNSSEYDNLIGFDK